MSMQAWLSNLSEAYITEWANKGLLRRGRKALPTQDINSWLLEDTITSANISGFTQTLSGSGFNHLHCSCSAVGPCFHLCCFLLGLQQRCIEKERENTEQTIDEHSVAPWLIEDEKQRQQELGKTSIKLALRWINQGTSADIVEDDKVLSAEIHQQKSHKVIIPRSAGIAASLCSCKKERCAHRALVVLQAGLTAGIIQPISGDDALSAVQSKVLEELDSWLQTIALQGMSGVSGLQLEQGHSIVTELQQVDLPNPAALQQRVVKLLQQEWRRKLISSPTRLRILLAELLGYISALKSTPMPQNIYRLAGRHKRNYKMISNLEVWAVSTELWRTARGFRGYSLHLYAPQQDRYYTLSEARAEDQDINWKPGQAFQQAEFGGVSIKSLAGSSFTIIKGWASGDGRLSNRASTRVNELKPFEVSQWLNYACSLSTLANKISQSISSDLYQADYQPWSMIKVQKVSELEFDRFQQQWAASARDENNVEFQLVFSSSQNMDFIGDRWEVFQTSVVAIYGHWSINASSLSLRPITLISDSGIHPLTLFDSESTKTS